MKQLEKSKIWALWALLTLSYSVIIATWCGTDSQIDWTIILRCALWNMFCLRFLFDYTKKTRRTMSEKKMSNLKRGKWPNKKKE